MFIVPGEVLVTSYCTSLNEKPQGFNPRVLEVCGVLLSYTAVSRTLEISGVRSYDKLPQLIMDQPEAIKPASLGIVLNC